MDLMQIVAIGTILSIFLAGFFGLKMTSGYFHIVAQNAPTLLTSAGIFFTFLGIFIALLNFDTSQIDQAIPKLLAGLQLAFLSSVVGIGSSILFRGVLAPLRQPADQIQDASVADLLMELRANTLATDSVRKALVGEESDESLINTILATKEAIDKVRESLTGDGDASLSTQFSKLRNDFRDFAESVKESGTNALIEALEQVIKDFNQKISEQFGENFKQLNEAVGALLQWQADYKIQVEQLTEAFRETQLGIELVRDSISGIEEKAGAIPQHMEKLEQTEEVLNRQILEIISALGTLADVKNAARDLVPELNLSIKAATDRLSSSFESQNVALTKSLSAGADAQQLAQADLQKRFDDMSQTLGDKITEHSGSIEKTINSALESQAKSQDAMREATDSMKQALEKNLENSELIFSEQMQKFQGVLDSMNIGADNVLESTTKVSEQVKKIVEDYSKVQEESTLQTKRKIEESIANNTEALNESMQQLDSSMQEQLQRALNLMGNNLTSITEQFVKTYETSASSLLELTERISRNR